MWLWLGMLQPVCLCFVELIIDGVETKIINNFKVVSLFPYEYDFIFLDIFLLVYFSVKWLLEWLRNKWNHFITLVSRYDCKELIISFALIIILMFPIVTDEVYTHSLEWVSGYTKLLLKSLKNFTLVVGINYMEIFTVAKQVT